MSLDVRRQHARNQNSGNEASSFSHVALATPGGFEAGES
jgi:hypothetical protein